MDITDGVIAIFLKRAKRKDCNVTTTQSRTYTTKKELCFVDQSTIEIATGEKKCFFFIRKGHTETVINDQHKELRISKKRRLKVAVNRNREPT